MFHLKTTIALLGLFCVNTANAQLDFFSMDDDRRLQNGEQCSWTMITGGAPCKELSVGGGSTSQIVVDGECNYNKDIQYYIAACRPNSDEITFLKAHCTNPDCTNCNEYVEGCDVGTGQCGFISNSEIRDSGACSEREDPMTYAVDKGYGVLGSCANPNCAKKPVVPLKEEPCVWSLHEDVSCKAFNPNKKSSEVIVDGTCRFNDSIRWYIATCTDSNEVAFRRAHCDPGCVNCKEFFVGCDFLKNGCGFISRNYQFESGNSCFQIRDPDKTHVFAYKISGSCGASTCAYDTNAIPPSTAPTPRPTPPPTPEPTYLNPPTDMPVLFTVTQSPTKGSPQLAKQPTTKQPTKMPTKQPTKMPTKQPTKMPTKQPTPQPTDPAPQTSPAPTPRTFGPPLTPQPSQPTPVPTTVAGAAMPTPQPTSQPSLRATTSTPTDAPSAAPTSAPTVAPSAAPTSALTDAPSAAPTNATTTLMPTANVTDVNTTDANSTGFNASSLNNFSSASRAGWTAMFAMVCTVLSIL